MLPDNIILEALQKALLDAFSVEEFERLVHFGLNKRIDEIILGKSQTENVFEVIDWAYRHGLIGKLVKAASERNPDNGALKRFIVRYGHEPKFKGPVIKNDLRTTYLERTIEQADQLLLSQITTGGRLPSRLSLRELYIPLFVRRPEWHDEGGDSVQNDEPNSDEPADKDWALDGYESMLEQANKYKQLIVVGGPGSGKSSFVKFLALCMAGELLSRQDINVSRLTRGFLTYDGKAEDSRTEKESKNHTPSNPTRPGWQHGGLLPIYIDLQDFVAGGFLDLRAEPTVDLLLRYLDAELLSAELERYENPLRIELRERGGILLLDGLDEVPDANGQRLWIQQAVADFASSYSDVHIIITSRPYALQKRSEHLADFHQVQLAPFTPDQIQEYIACAYPLLHSSRQADPKQPQAPNPHVSALQAFINHSSSLSGLAQTPLMLTLMVALFARQKGALPERREALYAQSIDLLLSEWEEPKRTPRKEDDLALDWFRTHPDRIRLALEEIAYQSHHSQLELDTTAMIDEDKIFAALTRATKEARWVHPLTVTEYLLERSGILAQQANGRYHFPHRTIQEYLAACHLHRQDNFVMKVIRLVRDDPPRWREVLLLSSAKEARKKSASAFTLIDRLCPMVLNSESGVGESEHSALLVMLSGRLLLETGLTKSEDEFDKRIIRRVKQMLVQVIDGDFLSVDDRLTVGLDLGVLGDLRVGTGLQEKELPSIEWHRVEPGTFLLGVKSITSNLIKQSYEISRYPITVEQFSAFIDAGGYDQKQFWTEDGWAWQQKNQTQGPTRYTTYLATPNQPQVGVSWYEAIAFCNWLSAELDQAISLPTEPEWERAARGTDGRLFPWGSSFSITDCNMRWTGVGHPSPVGIFPQNKSPCGAVDMVGNVWEWSATVWQSDYNNYEETINNNLSGTERRVLRGGSWANLRRDMRCANRHRNHPDHHGPNVGFRVVRR